MGCGAQARQQQQDQETAESRKINNQQTDSKSDQYKEIDNDNDTFLNNNNTNKNQDKINNYQQHTQNSIKQTHNTNIKQNSLNNNAKNFQKQDSVINQLDQIMQPMPEISIENPSNTTQNKNQSNQQMLQNNKNLISIQKNNKTNNISNNSLLFPGFNQNCRPASRIPSYLVQNINSNSQYEEENDINESNNNNTSAEDNNQKESQQKNNNNIKEAKLIKRKQSVKLDFSQFINTIRRSAKLSQRRLMQGKQENEIDKLLENLGSSPILEEQLEITSNENQKFFEDTIIQQDQQETVKIKTIENRNKLEKENEYLSIKIQVISLEEQSYEMLRYKIELCYGEDFVPQPYSYNQYIVQGALIISQCTDKYAKIKHQDYFLLASRQMLREFVKNQLTVKNSKDKLNLKIQIINQQQKIIFNENFFLTDDNHNFLKLGYQTIKQNNNEIHFSLGFQEPNFLQEENDQEENLQVVLTKMSGYNEIYPIAVDFSLISDKGFVIDSLGQDINLSSKDMLLPSIDEGTISLDEIIDLNISKKRLIQEFENDWEHLFIFLTFFTDKNDYNSPKKNQKQENKSQFTEQIIEDPQKLSKKIKSKYSILVPANGNIDTVDIKNNNSTNFIKNPSKILIVETLDDQYKRKQSENQNQIHLENHFQSFYSKDKLESQENLQNNNTNNNIEKIQQQQSYKGDETTKSQQFDIQSNNEEENEDQEELYGWVALPLFDNNQKISDGYLKLPIFKPPLISFYDLKHNYDKIEKQDSFIDIQIKYKDQK